MKYFLILIICLSTQALHSQTEKVDELLGQLNRYAGQDTGRVKLLNQLSIHILKIRPEQSQRYANEALLLSNQVGFMTGVAEANNNLAAYNLLKGKPDVALQFALAGVKAGESQTANEVKANSYATLGTIYHSQGDLPKALSYLRLARKLDLKSPDVLVSSKILNALGGIARDEKKYDSALWFYDQAVTAMKSDRDQYRLPEVLNNIGNIYVRLGNKSRAMEFYQESLKVAKASQNIRAQALALGNIGGVRLADKQYKEGEDVLRQALDLSTELGDFRILSQSYMMLAQIKNETGRFNEAHIYLSRFFEIKDSLQNIERIKRIAELEIQYEAEKKENTILLLEKNKKLQELRVNIALAGLLVVIIGSVAIYQFQRFRHAKNQQVLNLKLDRLTAQNRELSAKFNGVLSASPAQSQATADNQILKNAVEVINERMSDSAFSVDQMAKEVGMSRTNLHRKIKAITGFPPSELIRNIRMRKAASLLMERSLSISEISIAVGFEDHSYFTKSFKKTYGIVPSEYLDSLQELVKEHATVN